MVLVWSIGTEYGSFPLGYARGQDDRSNIILSPSAVLHLLSPSSVSRRLSFSPFPLDVARSQGQEDSNVILILPISETKSIYDILLTIY